MDGAAIARCMTVALTADQESACRKAIVPVELVACATVADAVKAMATVLPLVVAVADTMDEADRTSITEVAQAVGAELFDVEAAPGGQAFQRRILDALTSAERRRFRR